MSLPEANSKRLSNFAIAKAFRTKFSGHFSTVLGSRFIGLPILGAGLTPHISLTLCITPPRFGLTQDSAQLTLLIIRDTKPFDQRGIARRIQRWMLAATKVHHFALKVGPGLVIDRAQLGPVVVPSWS